MDKLQWDLRRLCQQHQRSRDTSYATKTARWRDLALAARQLKMLGFRNMRATSLKSRHVEVLVKHWQADGLSVGTLKNRMAHLRWWADQVDKPGAVPKDNTALGIPNRRYVTNESRAVSLDERLDKVSDRNVKLSLELQAAFGLRREEAMKLQPSYADRKDTLVLKDSWTKGGRPRAIPIRTEVQRALLDRAHQMAGRGSLIPPDRSYVQHLKVYEYQCNRAGLHKMHGLRHAYAQARYEELTGWPAPAVGGPSSKALTPEQKRIDQAARLQISRELGHEREQITAVYLGR